MADTKLLVIDDEVEFAATLCQRLNLRGFTSRDAHSGIEGLASFAELEPDVVLLDLKMPDMSGLDVLAQIKEQNPLVEVIILTGHGSVHAGIKAMEKGAYDYIMKPVDLKELLKMINAAITKKGEK